MKRVCTLVILIVFATLVYGQTNNPYKKYSVPRKELSELEWRLVQINLKLGSTGYFVYFDKNSKIFKVDKFFTTYTLSTTSPTSLRELIISECVLVESVIGSELQEFRDREKKDLLVTFIIGESSSRIFATYSSENFSFTDDYYNFRKENGQ